MTKQVLVVDKNPAVQKLMEFALSREGFQVFCFIDGLSALDSAFKTPPAVFLVDSKMEGMNLTHFLDKLRQRETLKEVPVLLLLNSGDVMDEAGMRSLGTVDSIKKPLDPIEVVEKVKTHGGPVEVDSDEAIPESLSIPPPTKGQEPEDDMVKIEELLGWNNPTPESPVSEAPEDKDQEGVGRGTEAHADPPIRIETPEIIKKEPAEELILFEEELQAPNQKEPQLSETSSAAVSTSKLPSDLTPTVQIQKTDISGSLPDQKEDHMGEASTVAFSRSGFSAEVPPSENMEEKASPGRFPDLQKPELTDTPPPAVFASKPSAGVFPADQEQEEVLSVLSPTQEEPDVVTHRPPEKASQQESSLPNLHQVEEGTRQMVQEAVQKIVHDVVEKVAWEVIPSLAEITIKKEVGHLGVKSAPVSASPDEATPPNLQPVEEMTRQMVQDVVRKIAQDVVEKVAWDVIPSLAEITIKKEIERLTAEI